MNAGKSLTERIAKALEDKQGADLSIPFARGRVAAHVAAVVHPVIETVERLQAIETTPEFLGGALIKCNGVPALGAVFELNDDGTWNDLDDVHGSDCRPEDVPLPAVLIWHPHWWNGVEDRA